MLRKLYFINYNDEQKTFNRSINNLRNEPDLFKKWSFNNFLVRNKKKKKCYLIILGNDNSLGNFINSNMHINMQIDIHREKMSCVFTTLDRVLKLRGLKLKGKELTLSIMKIIKYETSC